MNGKKCHPWLPRNASILAILVTFWTLHTKWTCAFQSMPPMARIRSHSLFSDATQSSKLTSNHKHEHKPVFPWSSLSSLSSLSVSMSQSPDETNNHVVPEVNGYVNGDTTSHQDYNYLPGYQLTPYQILSPYLFSSNQTGADITRTLEKAIPLIRDSIQNIQNVDMDFILQQSPSPISSSSSSSSSSEKTVQVLRIEQTLSHTVDPLCWLHSQAPLQQPNDMPIIYFSNANQTFEAAALGAAYLHHGAANEKFWNFLQSCLPPHSHVYGGERFDRESEPSEEWSSFGAGLWMLPTIEVRRQRQSHPDQTTPHHSASSTTTSGSSLAVHVLWDATTQSWDIQEALSILSFISHLVSECAPSTKLPPIISRDGTYGPGIDGQEVYERGVTAALEQFHASPSEPSSSSSSSLSYKRKPLEKVVLARRSDLVFDKSAHKLTALDLLTKWKFGSNEGGHLLYLLPPGTGDGSPRSEFFGCTPEQLFSVTGGKKLITEALAGTRPRGSTQDADMALSRDLFHSRKDRSENEITGRFIQSQLQRAAEMGLLVQEQETTKALLDNNDEKYFVRRLLHLQHICQRFECDLEQGVTATSIARFLLHALHPTPAVCGFPVDRAKELIQKKETIAFDRGFYAGPFGYIGTKDVEIVVAIRSGLLRKTKHNTFPVVSVYAGAGIVPGSTAQGEWVETSYKLNVVSSLFPSSPITLLGSPTPNAAWASAFIEELIRCGIRQFYVCPGSRSTPLVVALAKALRSNVGVVQAHSVIDERGAAFRALGYGRGRGRPAAVITSSGTATANLYPAIMEAGMDGIPLICLTADRPYENRETGANQAVDQVKTYSSTYLRWFRDIPPPTDEVPVSVALSDANHAVQMAIQQRGPVHINIQFRENLAPDGGPIRNDGRVDSITTFNGLRFTDVPNFHRWSRGGDQWIHSNCRSSSGADRTSIREISNLIRNSKRGMLVVGCLRAELGQDTETQVAAIAEFAQTIGFPIFAGVQSGSLRSRSSAVVQYAEHLLKSPIIYDNLKPDLILQIGHPLVSTEVPSLIRDAVKASESSDEAKVVSHVLIHPHHPEERSDPDFTLTHRVSSDIVPFLTAVSRELDGTCDVTSSVSSELSSLVFLGRLLSERMPEIIHNASHVTLSSMGDSTKSVITLTEPQVVLAITQTLMKNRAKLPCFLSNSMAVRDSEFFLYPSEENALGSVGVNRGASGIDGIISSAVGYAEAKEERVALLIGDLAAMHDMNSFHTLSKPQSPSSKRSLPITSVIVNNDGGGIFSFLPIASHGSDVNFEEFFGTPTSAFSFQKCADAFGLTYKSADNFSQFQAFFESSTLNPDSTIVEAKVVTRDVNVAVHKEITKQAIDFLSTTIEDVLTSASLQRKLPLKVYSAGGVTLEDESTSRKTLLLIHGWMGDKADWDDVAVHLVQNLQPEWSVVALDLDHHGDARHPKSELRSILKALRLDNDHNEGSGQQDSIDDVAIKVMSSLAMEHEITEINAIAGYSLGGRVAMAMSRLCQDARIDPGLKVIGDDTRLILLGSYPGSTKEEMLDSLQALSIAMTSRFVADRKIALNLRNLSKRAFLVRNSTSAKYAMCSGFLEKWYESSIWGGLKARKPILYRGMIGRRAEALCSRAAEFATSVVQCSPAVNENKDWKFVKATNTLFMAGEFDAKYSTIGMEWKNVDENLQFVLVPKVGHALLVEAPLVVAERISDFLSGTEEVTSQNNGQDETKPKKLGTPSVANKPYDSIPLMKVESPIIEYSSRLRPVTLDFEAFGIDMVSPAGKGKGVVGIGWGDKAQITESNRIQQRRGLVLQLLSNDGVVVGVGEVSPLQGLHPESLEEASTQLCLFQKQLEKTGDLPIIDPISILSLNGGLDIYLESLLKVLQMDQLYPSVRSGLEMALISFASHAIKKPVLNGLSLYAAGSGLPLASLALNGVVTRGVSPPSLQSQARTTENRIMYSSLKVKVGHQDAVADAVALGMSLQQSSRLRPDANRAWTEVEALAFANALNDLDVDISSKIEFVEEPMQKIDGEWNLRKQLDSLEKWHKTSGLKYAVDESIADLINLHLGDFSNIRKDLIESFMEVTGCAAVVLKPSLIGLELSMRLGKLIHQELGLGVVFSCAFESGVGLAYTAFLAATSDLASGRAPIDLLAHGIGTFTLLDGDTLSPSFASYVNSKGILQVASLSRAFFGLGLDEMRGSFPSQLPEEDFTALGSDYRASAATSSSGREISLVVSLPLPFSDEVACARFTDLPQQSRWSPWLSSVAYLDDGRETEWTLNVRGVKFSWKAVSTILTKPNRGIQWESVSGLKNLGIAEFIPTNADSCTMKVRMTILAPRMVTTLFPGASVFLEEFLQNKLLKWSLEMFRDVVKGDLALERGDVELGDALFGAVEGRANAIEASLSSQSKLTGEDVNSCILE